MGAAHTAHDDPWSLESLDDGWSLGEEGLGLALRPLPAADSNTSAVRDTSAAGWSLAGEADQSVPAVRASSTILNPLTDEELEAFSKAEFAMGTEVDFQVPDDAWFEDLRCIVPRRRAPSVSDSGGEQVARPAPASLAAPVVAPILAFGGEVHVPEVKKQRWWKRLRRS